VKRLWISSTAERSHYLRRLSLSDAIEEINHCSLPALCRFEPCRAYQRLELLAQAVDHPVDAVDLLDLSSPVALGRHKICCWGRKPSFSCGSGKSLSATRRISGRNHCQIWLFVAQSWLSPDTVDGHSDMRRGT
jgi:hypothetical protein